MDKLKTDVINADREVFAASRAQLPSNSWDMLIFSALILDVIIFLAVCCISLDASIIFAIFVLLPATGFLNAVCKERSDQFNKPVLAQLQQALEKKRQYLLWVQARLYDIYEQFWDYPPDWSRRRALVFERANRMCEQCGRRAQGSRMQFHVHHIKPRSHPEGHHGLTNLKLLCESCHGKQPEPGHNRIASARKKRARKTMAKE